MKVQIILTGLAIMALTTFASAQNPRGGRGNGNCNGTGKCSAFVDANKDGVCDNNKVGTANAVINKGNKNGKCNGTGQGQGKGKGKNFVDANKNGICDTYEAKTKK